MGSASLYFSSCCASTHHCIHILFTVQIGSETVFLVLLQAHTTVFTYCSQYRWDLPACTSRLAASTHNCIHILFTVRLGSETVLFSRLAASTHHCIHINIHNILFTVQMGSASLYFSSCCKHTPLHSHIVHSTDGICQPVFLILLQAHTIAFTYCSQYS